MGRYDYLKSKGTLYEPLGLQRNPFSIAPLFKDFKHKDLCEEEENFFILPERLEQEVRILLEMEDKRALVYGLYGVGKTSFVDFLLYLSHNFHKRFCTRVIITEDNVEKAINEVLLSLCFEILSEIERKKFTRPVESIRKWIAGKRYSDFLLSNMARLMGQYTENHETTTVKKKSRKLKAAPANFGVESIYDEEVTIRKGIQSYVEILPMRKIAEYLQDFLEIVNLMQFQDIIIFIDEADHLQKIEEFLKLLTKAREVLFSRGYTFFIAGSVEVAKYTESMGAIFDKLIFIKPASIKDMEAILEHRIQATNADKKLFEVFEKEATSLIHEQSKGIQKQFLRIAENALDEAVMIGDNKINASHCLKVFESSEDEVKIDLKDSQMRVLRLLSKKDSCSASDKEFQQQTKVGRTYLRMVLEELVEKGYVRKEKRGRQVYYSISSQYRAYFRQIE